MEMISSNRISRQDAISQQDAVGDRLSIENDIAASGLRCPTDCAVNELRYGGTQ